MQSILISSDNTVTNDESSEKDLIDANLLDMLRGKMSFGHKAFAIVLDKDKESAEIVYIQDNETVWKQLIRFFC